MEEKVSSWLNFIVNLEPESLRHAITVNVLTAWLVIVILVVMVRKGTARMELRPTSGWQAFWEWAYESFEGFCRNVIGPGGEQFTPFLGSVFIYILALNLFGVIPGFISPTASLNMTIPLAVTVIVYVQYCGARAHGWRYVLHFVGEPWWLCPINIPIHVIGEIARPLSLSIRLFGNIFGEDTVIAQLVVLASGIFSVTHVPIPVQFPMVLFHIFVSLVQALVFMMLSAAYISGAVAHEGHEQSHETGPQSAQVA
jgi:F-type H+-transporting ATPase subunit a